MDGLETNDPLTNLNSGLATNLVLGLNSIAEVTVNTTSYAVDQGRYGASQINYVTKSGTNAFHGNLYELWNGSKLNAAEFLHQRDGGQSEAALDREPFRRQPGRAGPTRQAVLLLRLRATADRAADRDAGDRAQPGVRRVTFWSNCRAAAWTAYRAPRIRRSPDWFPSIGICSRSIAVRAERRWLFWDALSTAMEVSPLERLRMATAAHCAAAFRNRAAITSR